MPRRSGSGVVQLARAAGAELLSTGHHAITSAVYIEPAEELSLAEIVELGWTCAQTMGGHRFMHTLDLLGEGKPVLE